MAPTCTDEFPAEVDHYWELLTADGGEPGACGWCTDKFGVSWQVIPRELEELSGDYSTEANWRVCQAMLTMSKIDVAALQAAHEGVTPANAPAARA